MEYIVKRDANGNRKKINLIIKEYYDEDGVLVSMINPDVYLSRSGQTYEEELTSAIALFDKSLKNKQEEFVEA